MLIPDYELLEVFARNSTANFYRARHRPTGEIVCVEWFTTFGRDWDLPFLQRRAWLLETAACLDHPSIWPVRSFGDCGRSHYYIRPLFSGQFLDRLIRPALPTRPQAVAWVQRIALAVQHAHDHGIFHGDLKPSNVMTEVGPDQAILPRLGGFETAEIAHMPPSLEDLDGRTGRVFGTPVYMAPERLSNTVPYLTPAGDIWSLGVMLYQFLVGRMPFSGSSITDIFLATLESEPASPHLIDPAIHPALSALVMRCLRKLPEQRYHSAAELAADLARFETPSAPPLDGATQGGGFLSWCTWFARWV